MLKNAHLLRYPAASPSWRRGKKSLLIRRDATPHPSPCQARGRLVAAYVPVRLTPQDFRRPRERDFAKLNLSLGIFEHPKEPDFFRTLSGLKKKD